MRGQSRSAVGMARHLTGRDKGLDNVVRIDPAVDKNRFALDKATGVEELKGLGYHHARDLSPSLSARFFGTPVEEFHALESARPLILILHHQFLNQLHHIALAYLPACLAQPIHIPRIDRAHQRINQLPVSPHRAAHQALAPFG